MFEVKMLVGGTRGTFEVWLEAGYPLLSPIWGVALAVAK
jgi:hypothetical protein